MSCYRRESDRWKFFEIDPRVLAIAQDERHFHFLSECAGSTPTILGDARLSLQQQPDKSFDVIVVDAFSSDSIPVNVITVEAFELYLQKIANDGLLMIHISNRSLDLEPVLGNLVDHNGWAARVQDHRPDPHAGNENRQGDLYRFSSKWVVIALEPAALGLLATDTRWRGLRVAPHMGLWSDDYSNILRAMRWARQH